MVVFLVHLLSESASIIILEHPMPALALIIILVHPLSAITPIIIRHTKHQDYLQVLFHIQELHLKDLKELQNFQQFLLNFRRFVILCFIHRLLTQQLPVVFDLNSQQ